MTTVSGSVDNDWNANEFKKDLAKANIPFHKIVSQKYAVPSVLL